MKILIYMSGGFDRHGPSNHLFSTLIEGFLKLGNEVVLIQKFSGGNLTELNDHVYDFSSFQNILIKQKLPNKNRLVKRYIYSVVYSFKSRKTLKNIFKNQKFDIVLVQSNPTPFFQLKAIRKFYQGKVVYNIQDMFPGSTIATGKMNCKIVQNFFYWLSKKSYEFADHFTVISEDSKRLLSKEGVSEDKITVILNWFNEEEVKEISWNKNKFVKRYNLSRDKFYIQYAGGMGYVFDYECVVNLAKKMINNNKIVFLMVGDGSQKNKFLEEIKKNNLTNVLFFPMQPQEEVAHVYSACNAQIIPLKRNVIGNSVPSKAALLMACKRLIINSVDEDSEYFQRFITYNIGVSVSNLNPTSLYEKVLDIYNNFSSYKATIENAHSFVYKHYTKEVSLQKYIQLFKDIL